MLVYKEGVDSNSIFCVFFKHWMHQMCSDMNGKLRSVYTCRKYTGEVTPVATNKSL